MRGWAWCVNVIVEGFRYCTKFVIVMKYLLSCWLVIDEQWTSERAYFQIYTMIYQYFSHFVPVKSTPNTFFFMVWRLEFLWCLERSGLILLTCVFVYMMVLVGEIVMMKGNAKVPVDNNFDRVWRTCFFHGKLCSFLVFKYFFHGEWKYNA